MTITHPKRPERPGRIRVRSAVLALLTVAALGLTTTGVSQAQQGAEGQPPQVGRIDSADVPTTAPLTGTSAFRAKSGERCEPTRAGSKERRAGAAEACVSTSPAPARSTATQQPLAAVAAAAGCDITSPGTYSYERFGYCVTGVNVVYILRDSNGKELGRGTLEISTSATLSASGTTWSEQVTVAMTGASGEVTALNAKFRASCGSGCTATKTAPWYGGDLTLGQSLSGTVAYSSTPAADTSLEFTSSYKLYVTSPGATAVDPNASWDNPRKIRCDNAVGGTSSAGCAIPSVMPVVPMSAQSSDPGGAVAAYAWAQRNLNDAWGQGKPLTRSTSGVADRTARTCGGFTAQTDLVATDTCGEFPFAETKEGGTDGAQCVEVIPNLGNGEWDTYILGNSKNLDRTRPCVRAHATAADKQFADAQLTQGFADQRVIDADQFEVKFTLPDTGPHARCLDTTPIGSLPSGAGWILNTTEPVPHVNKTTTPLGQAGEADPGTGMPGEVGPRRHRCTGRHPGLAGRTDLQGCELTHVRAGPVSPHSEHHRWKGYPGQSRPMLAVRDEHRHAQHANLREHGAEDDPRPRLRLRTGRRDLLPGDAGLQRRHQHDSGGSYHERQYRTGRWDDRGAVPQRLCPQHPQEHGVVQPR